MIFNNFIGGKWVPAGSGKTFDSLNPATGELVGRCTDSGRDDVSGADPRQYSCAQALTGDAGGRGSVRQGSRGVWHAAGGRKPGPGAQSEARGVVGQP